MEFIDSTMEYTDNTSNKTKNKAYLLNNHLFGKDTGIISRTDKKRDIKFMQSNLGRYYRPEFDSSHGENYKHYISLHDENDRLIIGSEFFFIGAYNKEKNLWIWGTETPTISVSIKDKINAFMSYGLSLLHSENLDTIIDKTKLSDFLTNRYSVMPTNDLMMIFSFLADKLYKDDTFQIITRIIDNNIGFFVLTNITFSNVDIV